MTQRIKTIMWVGLSMQKGSVEAFDQQFKSGKLLSRITMQLKDFHHVKTNLVGYAPLDKNGKLRYPNKKEMNDHLPNIIMLINKLSPHVIVIFGKKVQECFHRIISSEDNPLKNVAILGAHHPSYINIYRKKMTNSYINDILAAIKSPQGKESDFVYTMQTK